MRGLLVVLALLVSGCATKSTTASVDLTYVPASPPLPSGPPSIRAVRVTDTRYGDRDPTFLGVVRGGHGRPRTILKMNAPAADELRNAFEQALAARGLLGPQGRDTLTVQLDELEAMQASNSFLRTNFSMQLWNASGKLVYRNADDAGGYGPPLTDTHGAGTTVEMRARLEQAMAQAIDKALDRPAFLEAARSTGVR